MIWHPRYPLLVFALPGLGLLMGLEGAALVYYGKVGRSAADKLSRCQKSTAALAVMSPLPTAQNAALIEADLARTSQSLAAIEQELSARGPVADRMNREAVPIRRPEAFFDLAACVEDLRSRAQQAGVVLKADERFGFSAYMNEAPLAEDLTAMFRERQWVQYLVEALIDAKPHELIAVQRERPRDGRTAGGPRISTAGTGLHNGATVDKDFFAMDRRISVGVPGTISTRAFRLSFSGHTATLRTLLNRFASHDLPVVVRAVEVTSPAQVGQKPVGAELPPLVVPSWSRFTVTVEVLELAPAPSKPS